MSSNVEILIRGQDQASPAIRGVGDALQGLHDTAKSSGGGIVGSLQRIGETALGFLTAQAVPALFGMAQSAISAGADFGAVMNRIQAVSGATADELAAMNAKAMELGAALPISAKDAADAMYALVTAGYSASDAIAASTGVAQLASSQMMGVGQASEIVAAALRGFGLEAGEAGRVVDLLSQTASRSAVEVTDIGETLKYVGAVAGAAGQPLEDISAAIALMGNNGIKASMAGTALRSMITNLQAPTDSAAAAMAQLGIKTADSSGHMLPLMDIMAQFRSKMEGMTDAQQAQLAKSIAGKEAMAGFLSIVNAAPADFDSIRTAMENAEGATDKFAKAMNKGLAFEWGQLQGSIETVLIQGFQAAEPVLVSLASAATGFVNGLGDGLKAAGPVLQQVAQQITGVIQTFQSQGAGTATLLAAIGLSPEVAGQVGTLVAQMVAAVQGGLAQIQAAWATNGPAITAFAMQIVGALGLLVGFLASQLPGAISVVSGVIAGLIAVLGMLAANWQTIGGAIAVAAAALGGGALVGAITGAVGFIGTLVGAAQGLWIVLTAGGGVVSALGGVIALLGGPITLVVALVAGLAAAWATNFLGIRDVTAQAWAGIQSAFSVGQAALASAWTSIQAGWASLTASVSAAWTSISTTVVTAAMAVQASLAAWWGGVQASFAAGWATVTGATAAAWGAMQAAWAAGVTLVTGVATTAWSIITAVFTAGWSVVQGVSSVAWSILSGLFSVGMALLQAVVSTAWNAIAAVWSAAVAQIQTVTAPAVQVVQALWSAGVAVLQSVTSAAWTTISSTWSSAVAAVQSVTAPAITAVQSAWSSGVAAVQAATTTAWNAIQAAWNAGTSAVQSATTAAWSAITSAFATAWGQLTAATSTAWNTMTTAWNTAWQVLQVATAVAWAAVATMWSQAWGQLQALTAPAWNAMQAAWSSAWGALQGLTNAAWTAVQGAWNAAWGNVRSSSTAAWSQTESSWSSGWGQLQSATNAGWSNVQSAWNTAWNAVKATNPAAWGQVEVAWTTGWAHVQTTTATAWSNIQAAWTAAWAVVTGATSAAWSTINGVWAEAVGFAQGLMERLGGAFQHASEMIKGTVAALKKLADTAASLAGAIPEWMRPGSPMPLGIAFEHLAGVLPEASQAMGQFGAAARGASAAPTVDVQLLVNGQSTGDAGSFAAGLAERVRALIPPLASLGSTITEEVKTSLGRVNDGLKSVQSILETTFRLVQLTVNPPGLPDVSEGSPTLQFFRNVTSWARSAATAAAGVAAGFETVKAEGLTALNTVAGQVKTLLEATFGLVAAAANPPALPDVREGSATLTWFRNVTQWAKSVTSASAGVAADFGEVQTGGLTALNNAAGPLRGLLEATFGLVAAVANPPSLPSIAEGSTVLTWFRNATSWARSAATAAAGVAQGFETVATGGLTALNTTAGVVLGLIKATTDTVTAVADPPSLPPIAEGTTLRRFLTDLVSFARAVSETAGEAAQGFVAAAGDGLKALQDATGQALGVLKNTLDLLIVANTEYNIPLDFATTIRQLAQAGIEMAGAWLEVAATFTGVVTPAATEAQKSMDMAQKFIHDVYGLWKDILKEPPQFPSNFLSLIHSLVEVGMQIADEFIKTSNVFATNIGPGALALLSVFGKMDDFFKGFNKAKDALAQIQTDGLPTDAPEKIRSFMGIAIDMANAYIEKANSFAGTKGPGATNLETVIGGMAKLVKDTKDLLKSMTDWTQTPGGFNSDQIAGALALFGQVMQSLGTLSESGGTSAGTGFMTAFAQAIRDHAGQVYDALREVLAGAGAILPGGGSGGGGGGGGQSAAAAGGSGAAGANALAAPLGGAAEGTATGMQSALATVQETFMAGMHALAEQAAGPGADAGQRFMLAMGDTLATYQGMAMESINNLMLAIEDLIIKTVINAAMQAGYRFTDVLGTTIWNDREALLRALNKTLAWLVASATVEASALVEKLGQGGGGKKETGDNAAALAGTASPSGGGDTSGIENAVAAGVTKGLQAAQKVNSANGGAGTTINQNVNVNLSTAAGLDSTLTLLMNMAKG